MKEVKYGTYLILPLKYDEDSLRRDKLSSVFPRISLETMDINENIKVMFNSDGDMNVGSVHSVREELLARNLGGKDCRVMSEGKTYEFHLMPSYMYIFHTRIAFLCLGITFDDMACLYAICNPGFAESSAKFTFKGDDGTEHEFALDKWVESFASQFGLRKFFDGKSSVLLEAYSYILALQPEHFPSLEALQQATFNLHLMMPVDAPVEDESESDIRYVYAVKNQMLGAYRWGCCVASQTISYAVADENMDLEAEMSTQAQDGMPIVLLALYAKYTCLRFTELIAGAGIQRSSYLKSLKDLMLKFRAFGNINTAGISRWNNVRQIYSYLEEVSGISSAVEDINNKLNIVAEHQQEIDSRRGKLVERILSAFGIVSISATLLDLFSTLYKGGTADWIATGAITLMWILVFAIVYRKKK